VGISVKIKHLKHSVLPNVCRPVGAATIELYAAEKAVIPSGGAVSIPTGLVVEIPTGWMGLILGKYSLAKDRAFPLAGVIHPHSKNEVHVLMYSTRGRVVYRGDKVGQLSFLPCPDVQLIETHEEG
jgi:dUTPase